jgi:hypothetical protein
VSTVDLNQYIADGLLEKRDFLTYLIKFDVTRFRREAFVTQLKKKRCFCVYGVMCIRYREICLVGSSLLRVCDGEWCVSVCVRVCVCGCRPSVERRIDQSHFTSVVESSAAVKIIAVKKKQPNYHHLFVGRSVGNSAGVE